jgi:ankyrin repeat protein
MYIFAERNYAFLLEEDINAGLPIGFSKERYGHPFHAAVLSGKATVARILRRFDAALGAQLDGLIEGKPLLSFASRKGNLDMVKLLLELGAAPDTPCNDGKTALIYAT